MNKNSCADQDRNPGTHSAYHARVKLSTFLSTAILCVALLGLAAGWAGHKPAAQVEGQVEATQITVVPQIGGTVESWHVRQGDQVRKGQLLVCLENQDLQTKLEQARAATAEKPRHILRGSFVEKLSVQSNWWVKAKAIAEQMQDDVDHSRELQATGVISLQELRVMERDLDLARSSERVAKANFDLAVALCGEVERLAAAAEHEHATQVAAELEAVVPQLSVTSPVDGEVRCQFIEKGESVTPGSQVATVLDLQDLWVTFKVPEDLLSNLRMANTFRVRVPSLANQEVMVKVNYIAPSGNVAHCGRAKKTGHLALQTFEVRAAPIQPVEGLRPGMSVIADWAKFN